MSDNIFLSIKLAITALCTSFSIAFGWLGWLSVAWVFCMTVDWITGSIAAGKRGEWSSSAARHGILGKAGMIVVVLVAAITDSVIVLLLENLDAVVFNYTGSVLFPVVLSWYIFTELGSIIENATAMGAPVPRTLTKVLKASTDILQKL